MPEIDFPARLDNIPPNPTPTPAALAARRRRPPPTSPGELFRAHATPAAPGSSPLLRRVKSAADWLADADEAGFSILVRAGLDGATYYTTRRGPYVSTLRHRTPGDAAMAAAISAGYGSSVAALTYWRVPGWLADALAERGEAVHIPTGTSPAIWGCTEPNFEPDASPVLASVFEAYMKGTTYNGN